MQRKATKNTRGPNAEENRFQAWLKERPCCVTGNPGPSIVHHCEGATFKNNKVLVGHWFCLPLSKEVDDVVTQRSRKAFRDMFGPQCLLWAVVTNEYLDEKDIEVPDDVVKAIMGWGR